jgi:hypothetical protein
MREYQGVKLSWVALDRIVSEEILRDDGIRCRVAESGRPLRSHATGMSDDDLKRYDYFHSDDPVEAAKFVVPDAVAALWGSVLRHDGFAAFARRAPEQLIRWEADYGWTRRGYGQVAEKETPLAVPLARLLTTPDMWRAFAESYLKALEVAGRADAPGHLGAAHARRLRAKNVYDAGKPGVKAAHDYRQKGLISVSATH